MYLVDNLGTRYDHIETRGAAADGGLLKGDQDVLKGVFVFPAPRMGANEFSFRDDDQHVVIHGITSSERSAKRSGPHCIGSRAGDANGSDSNRL